MRRLAVAVLVAGSMAARAQGPSAAACSGLKTAHFADTTITSADLVPAGQFPVPPEAQEAMKQGAKLLPTLCRVVAEIKPTPDSDIKMELWMPNQWNGRFHGEGNGGFAGEIYYQNMSASVKSGYASAGTDTGHAANFLDASWAKGHPEKIADFGYRAIHLMTERSKELVAAYYGKPAKKSYFAACSDGGREALMEAQRFPADYDGILAGAPAYNWTALVTTGLKNSQALLAKPESYIPASKLRAISAAALAACDGKSGDGVSDGILAEPDKCKFKPETLLCKAGDSDSCLTAPQLKALETIYAGTVTKDGTEIYPGYVMGGEADAGGWAPWIVGAKPGQSLMYGFATGYFGDMVYPGRAFDFKTASIDQSYADAQQVTAKNLNATDPNLKPFFARGGKLVLYHGWSDAAITPLGTIDYYKKVVAATGSDSVKLYMVPGMDHCSGGPGADSFVWPNHGSDDPKKDAYLALQNWVEGGSAPREIVATKYAGGPESSDVEMTRPICPYPEVAKYKGTGDTKVAESFACSAK
ncbi:feruloyl esterase [Granulicella aggregans]|uniref:Feruloyl esterase n=1 Tax=Granulicella aggregans TaxID=474949 RepID=A0A7W8E5N1_9BACT|nr:tannase/feruloyl esterase family alpha/beta hydrolase [Granulicella aggregans]MBB5059479.1 feruloyl esterase [Granulicella aggregans]